MNRLNSIKKTDRISSGLAKKQWDSIAKPLGSFGVLEDFIQKIASIQKTSDVDISKRAVVVMCADNGVVCEGVTQTGSEVTAMSAIAIAEGRSNINALAETFNAEVVAVDIGINHDVICESLINRKVAYGTKNIAVEQAMTMAQAEQAVCTGMDIVRDLKEKGVQVIVTGEMGIGNTTTASAVSAVLLDVSAEKVTGRGAGLTAEGLQRKISAVKKAISVNRPDRNNPLDVLAKVGGFDIAGMTGLFLGGAVYGVPVIIDGVISAVSAVLACKINPLCAEYMLASHISGEPAGIRLLESVGLHAVINAGLRLGEGTGGIMLLPLLDGALSLYRNAHRFDDMGIERYVELK
ncbi:MAG: nicotinate-nucleotide--dimethylbenzimidazole phosphoribosyltransferase [Ruminococcus flavefaciens]|nr:nicotinate-nucleotide--dimethylbenzimidazole phosphoribosyltransferase [Ruminococcus flavefaciens]